MKRAARRRHSVMLLTVVIAVGAYFMVDRFYDAAGEYRRAVALLAEVNERATQMLPYPLGPGEMGGMRSPDAIAAETNNALQLLAEVRGIDLPADRLAELNDVFKRYRAEVSMVLNGPVGEERSRSFGALQQEYVRINQITDELQEQAEDRAGYWESKGEVGAIVTTVSASLLILFLLSRFERSRRSQERAEEAQRSHQRFQALVQNATDVIAIIDRKGCFTYVSPACERVWSRTADQLVGRATPELVHPDDFTAVSAAFGRAMEQPGISQRIEVRIANADGGWRQSEVILNNLIADGLVGGVVVTCRDLSERKEFETRLASLAFSDPLTGLPNRQAFLDALQAAVSRAERTGEAVCILFLDLDNFKVVNDSLGHGAGDRFLVQVASRLRAAARRGDVVARLGGDEFTVLLGERSTPQGAVELAQRIAAQLNSPVELDGHEIVASTSIGIASTATGSVGVTGLVQDADLAMYRAKATGKARYALCDSTLKAAAVARLELETDLRRAVEREEFCLHYQPIVCLKNGEVVEVEALVRWLHPKRGLVLPGEFMEVAEETHLIVPLGLWVLNEACRMAKRLHDDGRQITISVNLSAQQLLVPGFPDQLRQVLDHHLINPGSLRLEITETVMLQHTAVVERALAAIKGLGVQLAIDDFGTGYSSLSYLRRYRFDVIKIDRSFVDRLGTDSESDAIIHAVILLAKALNLKVTAEGTETVQQYLHLRALGCEFGQGYLFSRPVPEHLLLSLLDNRLAPADEVELLAGRGRRPRPTR